MSALPKNSAVTQPECQPVFSYLRLTAKTVDGRAWIAVCIATLFSLTLLLTTPSLLPLREAANPSKALVLLGFTPVITFLAMVVLRQLPVSDGVIATMIRAAFCVATFLVLNF